MAQRSNTESQKTTTPPTQKQSTSSNTLQDMKDLPDGSELKLAGVTVAVKGEKVSAEETERRFSEARKRMAQIVREKLAIDF